MTLTQTFKVDRLNIRPKLIASFLIVALLVAFGYVRKRVTQPLMEKTRAMNALANEQLDVTIEGTERADEIGAIAAPLLIRTPWLVPLKKPVPATSIAL